MKNKLMERPLMGGVIKQRIDNNMFSLSDLAKLYEAQRFENGWIEKRIDHFFGRAEEKERIIQLLELQDVFVNVQKHTFMEHADNKGLIPALKSIGQYVTTGRGVNKATYCNPYIFVAVAQWLNPKFWAHIIVWVTDSLILNRIEAGNNFNKLCAAISDNIIPLLESDNAKKFIYSNFTKLINKKVFGRHDNDLRQIASKEQLSQLNDLETRLTTLIEVGYIKDYNKAKEYISKL